MLFHLPPASVQVQSNNDEKQKSNNDTMDQVQQQQSLIDVVEKQLCGQATLWRRNFIMVMLIMT